MEVTEVEVGNERRRCASRSAPDILALKRTRALTVDEALEARVRGCEPEQLDAFLLRATSVASVDELFAG